MMVNMMKLSTLLALAAGSSLSQAQSCNGGSPALDGADFILADQGDNAHLAPLSKIFADAGKLVNVSDVFADGNHAMTGSDTKLKWESTADFDDFNTHKWVPQGISSTADAAAEGTYDGADGWVISWHNDGDTSVRVTFIDRETKKYRHALLVYPEADDDFRAVPIHAGGIVWYGDTLWVVDTWNGIRVFDMSNIWQVGSGDGVGKVSDGEYSAANYKYVIPQIRWYKWTPTSFKFRHSWVSLDRTVSPHRLLVGEYNKDASAADTRVVQYELDEATHKLKGDETAAVFAHCVAINRMQGGLALGDTFFLSRSNGASNGDLFSWTPGNTAVNNVGFYPPSPEDLSYDERTDVVYGLTEVAGGRYVFTDKRSDIKT
ncbi:hypothetical protein ACRE_022450 [Hapsidospora chrysogenum ATCC 11550]|uniref:Secreted protein n=1 Tax=Hapsidospora chrysogenum (strain ATCC 11550 / CBS 779.69 / DSM 880 / IAM 14645 / JCM 23072 / IMI 49137) TaxID=857340 RepID=A0A086TC49_HAPC1|nr:hypothetical protein ACRE_022450 [Hapsidospora chrysogenum ATCC 11550]